MQLCQTTKWYLRHLMLNAIPSDDLCSGPAVHRNGQRVPRPPRIQDRRENPARSLHQVRFGVFRQNTCDYSGVYIRLDLNCVLRQNTNNDYSGTWSERTCRWCLPRRTGTCWAAPWSTSPGPALSPAWGSPAGPFRAFHFWVLLFTFANFQVHSAGTWSPWSSSLSSWISPSPSSSTSCPGSTLETPTGRWSTRTGRPALCLPSLRLRLCHCRPISSSSLLSSLSLSALSSFIFYSIVTIIPSVMIHIPHTEKCQGWVDFEVSINGGPYYWKGMFYVGKSAKTGKVFILWNFLFGSIFLQRPPPQAQPSSGLRRRTLTTWWGGSSILYLIISTWWPSHSSIWYLKILTTWLPSLLPHIWSFIWHLRENIWEQIFESCPNKEWNIFLTSLPPLTS